MPAKMDQELAKELVATANAVATAGKGILAADESTGTIGKRFAGINVENTEENRAFYRGLLFSTKGLGQYISGAILFEETLYQKNAEGVPMVDLLKAEGIIPGIKVDKGLVEMMGSNGEKSTQGLDGLAKRCQDYYQAGARFAKWRAVLSIEGDAKPSQQSIRETAHTLARYAAICQENRLVPIVEPEILTDGPHDIQKCAAVTEVVLSECFRALNEHNILMEGCLLKPNMVTAGSECATKPSAAEIGYMTARTLARTAPPALVGVMFLSGGQSEEDASLNLSAMNQLTNVRRPWVLSFSYGRALQASVLKAWAGNPANKEAAQATLMERAKANSEAQLGKYVGNGKAGESLFEANYAY